MRLLFAALALALSTSAVANEPASWRAVDAETGKIRDIDGLEQLARDFPDSGTVRLRMLQPYLEAGEAAKAMELLEWLYERGYVFSDVAKEQIPKLLEGVDPGRIAERLIAEPEIIAASELVATAPAKVGLVESVLSRKNGYMFSVTSVSEKGLFGVLNNGKILAKLDLEGNDLSGIVASSLNRNVWVASGDVDQSNENDLGYSGLIGFVEGAGDLVLIEAPDNVTPSDITIGPDETLYASDPLGGGVYTAKPSDEQLTELIASGTFRSPQGLATSADNTKLYVSDYRYGIAVVDLATRDVSRLASDIPVILDGVDGLWRHGNELIAVQNGTSPMRISAFELSEDGLRVVGHRILEQANPEWTEPLGGSIDGDHLIYVGNGQWDRYIEGELAAGAEPMPTQIRRLPLARE